MSYKLTENLQNTGKAMKENKSTTTKTTANTFLYLLPVCLLNTHIHTCPHAHTYFMHIYVKYVSIYTYTHMHIYILTHMLA